MSEKIENSLYYKEISSGINWIFSVQEKENFGWSWIKHISPNIQNTSEVIYTMSKNSILLDDKQKEYLRRAVEYWLLEPQYYAVLSRDWIWSFMAIKEYEKSDLFEKSGIDLDSVKKTKTEMIKNILLFQNNDGGWSDNAGGISATSRTGLAIKSLSTELNNIEVEQAVARGAEFLISVQNDDGGFGNMRKVDLSQSSQKKLLELDYQNVEAQYTSNAACTAYCVIAFVSISQHKFRKQINAASKYLINIQQEDGHWDLFYEVGMKKDSIFTFRHFGTAWALQALFDNSSVDNGQSFLLKGIQYLLKLQENVYGGWKSSPDSDTYTWSTCNALCVMASHKEYYENIKAEVFYKLLNDWRFGRIEKGEDKSIKHNKNSVKTCILFYWAIVATFLAISFLTLIPFDFKLFKYILTGFCLTALLPLDLYIFNKLYKNEKKGIVAVLLINCIILLIINIL